MGAWGGEVVTLGKSSTLQLLLHLQPPQFVPAIHHLAPLLIDIPPELLIPKTTRDPLPALIIPVPPAAVLTLSSFFELENSALSP